MDDSLDQYFELAVDLPPKMRAQLLAKLDREDPGLGKQLRGLLDRWVTNPHFACEAGEAGRPKPLDRLHHVALQVANIGEAVRWYQARFGCAIDYADATWAMLRFENFRLALVLPEQHPPHFALERADLEEFGEVRSHRDGTRYVYTEDPWGNTIEILGQESPPG